MKAETSLSYSLGLVLQPIDRLYVTLDAYQIDVDDRIILSGNLSGAALEDVNLAGAAFRNVNLNGVRLENVSLAGLTVDGIEVGPLLEAERHRLRREAAPPAPEATEEELEP